MVSHPFEALSCGLHFGKIVIFIPLGSYDGCDHCSDVDHLLVGDGYDPSGCTAVNVGITFADSTGTYSDKR